ncbi:MAG: flagellar filament outer layer protein FlaA [Treponema sp.]|nr:flagellar filament outer layer protein FlaA [Treponema sp.]
MRRCYFKTICIVIIAFITVLSAFGDEFTNDWQTKVIDDFNGDSEYVWKTDASRFITITDSETFPKLAYINTWPIAVFGSNFDGELELRSLGLHGRFDRRGYNWIDIFPTDPEAEDPDRPIEIPIPGRVRTFDMWVWGSNLNFYIEIFLRDYQGVIHSIRLGDIGYTGWRNLRANVPNNISQRRRVSADYAGLRFVKFRLWTQPVERVNDFYVYFKQFKILTDMFETYYDGHDLGDARRIRQLWAEASEED